MPYPRPRRLLREREEVHLAAGAPVVALFSLREHGGVGLELLLVLPAGAVDALELRVARVAAPVGAGDLHQLERMPELAGRRQVRADAEVEQVRSEEHTSELQSLMRISYAVFCLKKKSTAHRTAVKNFDGTPGRLLDNL